MKKFLIASGVAVLAFASVASAQGAVFNTNLTVGSTGPDVANLQTWLINNGFSIPSIASGAAAKGYFGAQTKTAVMAYQASRGIPNTGFVGPLTRQALNAGGGTAVNPGSGTGTVLCPIGYTCSVNPGSGTGTVNPPVVGGTEGQLVEIDNASADIESSLDESESNVKVFGVEVEAEDSAMTIDRIDVDFTLTDAANGSDDLEDYITEVSLYNGNTKLATKDVDEADVNDGGSDDLSDDDNDVYSFRFSGLKSVVAEGASASFYVAVSTVNSIDDADDGDEWAVIVPDDGIRATDSAGISDTYVSGSELSEEEFSVGIADVGDLEVTEADANPESAIVVVDEDTETDDVVLLVVELEADNAGVTVNDLPVNILTNETLSDVVRTVYLVRGSTVLDSQSVPSTGSSAEIVFEDLDLEIDEGDTEELKVVVDLKKQDGNFSSATTTLAASTSLAADASWDVEDENGEDANISGVATGNTMTLNIQGITVSLVGTPTAVKNAAIEGSADSVDFTINFTVKNDGTDDIWIDGAVVQGVAVPTSSTAGLAWATTTASNTGTSTVTAVLEGVANSSNPLSSDASSDFRVRKGSTRTFSFSVTVPTGIDNGTLGVGITGIKWGTSAGSTDNLYNFGLENFGTQTVTGLQVR